MKIAKVERLGPNQTIWCSHVNCENYGEYRIIYDKKGKIGYYCNHHMKWIITRTKGLAARVMFDIL